MKTVAVVDYGMGNLRSVAKAFEHVAPKARVEISGDAARILATAPINIYKGIAANPEVFTAFIAFMRSRVIRAPTTS